MAERKRHPAMEDDTTRLQITPSEDGDSIDLSGVPVLDGAVTADALALMIETLPAATLQPGEFDEEEVIGNLTASKFLELRAGEEEFYSGMLAGYLGAMTLLNICAPGVTNSPRLALMYRVAGLVARHLDKTRNDGPKKG